MYLGHVVEHVAIELTKPAGVAVTHGKTRRAGEPGVYNVVVEYKAELVSVSSTVTSFGEAVGRLKFFAVRRERQPRTRRPVGIGARTS